MGKLCRSLVLSREVKKRWTSGRLKQVNESAFVAICDYDVNIVSISGETVAVLKAEEESEDNVHDVVVDGMLRYAVTSHTSQLLKMWTQSGDDWEVVAQWRCPGKFPAYVELDPEARVLACATAGQKVYFFQLQNQNLFKQYDIPKGRPTAMSFDASGHLWVGDDHGHLSVIDVDEKRARVMADDAAHHSSVTAIVSMPPYVITAGLDQVVLMFTEDGDAHGSPIAVASNIHDLVVDPRTQNVVIAATSDGIKRVDVARVALASVSPRVVNRLFFFDALYSFDDDMVLRTVKANGKSIPLSLPMICSVATDRVTDTIAVASASNSFILHVFKGNDSIQLSGHTAMPVCLAAVNGLLISGARDHTARIWSLVEGKAMTMLEGHADTVHAVSFIPKSDCVLTAAGDRSLKLWRPLREDVTRSALSSVIAHERAITCVATSIDGLMCATSSEDKTAKLWRIADDKLEFVRVFKGHRRMVCCVAFSPVDRVVASGGGDSTVKLWSIDDGSCLASFTEFTSSVMRLFFISEGLQIMAGESKGAIKVVRAKTGAPDFTLESAHEGHIWGLCEGDEKTFVSGADDGKLCVWLDNSEEIEAAETQARAETAEAEQDLRNALRNGQYVVALRLAFKLRMPHKLRLVVREVVELGLTALDEYFSDLEDIEDYEQWIDYVSKWATNSRWADDATAVITSLLKVKHLSFFTSNKRAFQTKIDAIIPYLERHFNRLDRLNVQAFAIDDVLENTS